MPKIPIIDLRAQYLTIQEEIDAAVRRSIEKTAFIGGEEHEAFEREFAAYTQVRFCAGVANGTDALVLALRAMGVGPGDRVLTTPYTFIATVEAITLNGAIPVFADIDPVTYTISPEAVEKAIESMPSAERATVKVLLPVHLYGQPAEMPRLLEIAARHGLMVLEDCAQSHGATIGGRKVGSYGLAATYSFYPGKNLGAYGDAGAIVTNDPVINEKIRSVRNHGRTDRYFHTVEGVNSRLDGIQAAVLRVKLRRLDEWNRLRREFASLYDGELSTCHRIVRPIIDEGAVYHLYTIRHPERERLREFLAQEGIAAAVHYPLPLHLQPAFSRLGLAEGAFPEAEAASRDVLSLPLYPEMGADTVRFVAAKIREFEES